MEYCIGNWPKYGIGPGHLQVLCQIHCVKCFIPNGNSFQELCHPQKSSASVNNHKALKKCKTWILEVNPRIATPGGNFLLQIVCQAFFWIIFTDGEKFPWPYPHVLFNSKWSLLWNTSMTAYVWTLTVHLNVCCASASWSPGESVRLWFRRLRTIYFHPKATETWPSIILARLYC